MNWLLVSFPIAIVLEAFAPERPLFVSIASSLAILPLAGWMGRSTEQLANRMGEGVGGLQGAGVPISRAAAVLAVATAGIVWMSEILVGVIEPTAHEFGLSNVFVGVFVVAILGNAAEHATAISAALKDRMDLALSIAIGSSVQVALFVAPVLVLASFFLGPTSMDLTFPRGLILMVLLSALITSQVAGDGRSDWLKGLQLLAVYLIFGLAFFFLPSAPPQ